MRDRKMSSQFQKLLVDVVPAQLEPGVDTVQAQLELDIDIGLAQPKLSSFVG